jgi:hypothetical protein
VLLASSPHSENASVSEVRPLGDWHPTVTGGPLRVSASDYRKREGFVADWSATCLAAASSLSSTGGTHLRDHPVTGLGQRAGMSPDAVASGQRTDRLDPAAD